MKAKQYSFKRYPILLAFLIISIFCGLTKLNAQCPTVINSSQTLCDVQSLLVGDLQAIDNGGGIVWYDSPTSTVPLLNTDSLISGEDYYADSSSGTCGTRARVDITIYGPPIGDNFQGVCLDDPSLATVGNLVAAGNDVQWYLSPTGGTPLNDTDILMDNTIYYADQASPDGSCRTSRLSVLVLVGATPIPTGDMIQNFCVTPQYTPTVGDLEASGTNNWYISLFSALPLPPSTPLINGQTYYATTLDPPCESTGRLSVLAILDIAPNAGDDNTLNLCDNTNSTIDLFAELGGNPDAGGTWTPTLNSGTGVFDPAIDPEGVYTYTVSSNNSCPDDSATVTVTLIPEPNAGTDGVLNVCSNSDAIDLFLSLGGTPETGGVWSPSLASGTGEFNPALDSDGIYTYTVSGNPPCVDATATVNVTVNPFKDAGEDGSIDLCDNSALIDLFDSLEGTPDSGGVWSPALSSGTGVFDPAIDSPGVYTYAFTGNSPCPDESATVTVTINPLPNAGSDGIIEICSNDLATIDLFDSLGGNPDTGGTWFPALNSGTGVFNPSIDTAGVYTYTVVGIPPCSDASANVNVIIAQEPDAGLDAVIDICTNNGTIDLFNSLGGTPEIGGTWSPALASGSGLFDPLVDTNETYTYTVSGTNPCADATATITITVTPFLSAGTDGAVTVCTDDGTIDLFDSLGGTPELGGTWSPTLASGTGVFDPNVDTEGTYTYSTFGTEPCLDDSAIVVVTVEQSPDAGTDGTLLICSLSNTVNLFDSLNGTPQTGGTWSPALSSGTGIFDPNIDSDGIYTYTINSICGSSSATVSVTAIDANSAGTNGTVEICSSDTTSIDLFDHLGGAPDTGGTWTPALTSGTGIFDPTVDTANTYTYTVSNSATPCPDDSATVTVTILEEPNAGNDGTLNLCNSTNTVNLFDSLAGTPEVGGTWSPALNSGTGILDPNIDSEGVYTYTLNNACGTSSATVTVSFSGSNDAGTDGTIDLCSTDSSIDLFNSLGGTPDIGGTWTPTLTSGTGLFDPSIDAAGTYTYTVSSPSAACPDATATVVVSVLQEPNAGNDGTLDLCSSDTSLVDLIDSLGGNPDAGGTWSPALNSGTGMFNLTLDTPGVYTYSVSNLCGNSSATVTVSISNTNDAGSDGSIEFCSNDASVDLFDSLGGTPDIGGTWTPALASGTGIFDPSIDAAGIYTYAVSDSTSSCPEATATVTVTILAEPNAGTDNTLNLCIDETVSVDLFDSLGGSPDTGGTWTPALTSGTGIFDPLVDPAGVYTYTVTSAECGITNSATVTVTILDLPDVTGLTMSIVDNVICVGLEDAIIDITGANQLPDGDYSIVYALTEANNSVNTVAITITGGNATFTIPQTLIPNSGLTLVTLTQLFVLGQNCSAITSEVEPIKILVEELPEPELIADGTEFCLEDNPTIQDLSNNIINDDIVIWYDEPIDGMPYNSDDVLQEGVIYYGALTSEFGCESHTRLEVSITFISCIGELLIPDGFSPNDDGINDVFNILWLDELYPNFKLSVYNRYGNILYEGDINTPKWDGTGKNNNSVLPAGVYFYVLEFNDGERKAQQGRVYLNR
ncbi:T9SS type B sorting domain-containing protein [Winogradskyella sp. PC D3.3]